MLTTPDLVKLANTFDPTLRVSSEYLLTDDVDRTVFQFQTFEAARDFYDAAISDTPAVGYPFPQEDGTVHVVTRSRWS